jgi:hypothetical protein
MEEDLDKRLDEIVRKYSYVSDEKTAQEGLREALGLLAKYKSDLENMKIQRDGLLKENEQYKGLCKLTVKVKRNFLYRNIPLSDAQVRISGEDEIYLITNKQGICSADVPPDNTYDIEATHENFRSAGKMMTIRPGQKTSNVELVLKKR